MTCLQIDCATSLADGTYVLAVTTGTSVKINTTYGDHLFRSSFNATALPVTGPISQLDFQVRTSAVHVLGNAVCFTAQVRTEAQSEVRGLTVAASISGIDFWMMRRKDGCRHSLPVRCRLANAHEQMDVCLACLVSAYTCCWLSFHLQADKCC